MVASWVCEVTEILTLKMLLLCEDYSDVTSPTSNQIPDIDIALSVAYDTFEKSFFMHACMFIL